ncbi:MAG: GGDEF domain-containing protein [Actinomycetota bacterium]|nr:GGDEF domain-containing protein [Actinomycetota bacterium]
MIVKLFNMPKGMAVIVSLAALALIGYLDNITGNELSLSAFYLLPIAVITMNFNKAAGVLAAIASAVVQLMVHVVWGGFFYPPLITFWNMGILMAIYIIISLLLSSLKVAVRQERENARKDFLTGIANWQAFIELAERELERAKRFKCALTMAYIDCDNFKAVNDNLGHRTGDVVLRSIAAVLQKHVRKTDVNARIGGDEFAILFVDSQAEGAQKAMTEIRRLLLEEMGKGGWDVTFSIGLATFEEPPGSVDLLVGKAEELMYGVKKNSQNAIRYEVVRTE